MPGTLPFADAIEKLDFHLIRSKLESCAVSEYGKERLRSMMPMTIFAEVRDELQRVGEMMALLTAGEQVPMHSIPDCRRALHRAGIEASILSAEDFRDIVTALRISRELKQYLARRSDRLILLPLYVPRLIEDKLLEYHIDRVVDEEGNVRDNASKELRRIRKDITEKSALLRRRMESLLKRVSGEQLVQEELVTMRDGRLVLPVKAEYKRQVHGFIHSSSATGQTVYIEPMETLELNNDIRDLQFDEQREIARILDELTVRLRASLPALHESLAAYSELDSLYARAYYGNSINASVPDIHLERRLMIQQGRHPILLLHKKYDAVIPMDITIGDPETTIIITGPNAGGKSVTMKTVGLLAMMTQCGVPTPCAQPSVFPMYDDILVDIGDEQSVENDLSTFSSHVQRLARIVASVTGKSLVLIDEIGTGTDPSEGSALGASILEYLTSRGGHVITTTHHGMLKAVAHEHPKMQNATMEFDLDSLQPTYRFRAGLPGSSYAFEITRRHGMRQEIIDRGREILDTKSDALEQLLVEVERKSQELGKRLRESEAASEKYKALVADYETKLAAVKEETRRMKKEALEQAEGIVQDAQGLIERTVKELRERQADKEAIKTSLDTIKAKQSALQSERRDASPEVPREETVVFQKGDIVMMQSGSDTQGTILDDTDKTHVLVAFGNLKMRIERNNLTLVRRSAPPKESIPVNIPAAPESYEIDVRGLYGDEAVKEVDTFLYQAYTSGLPRVDIIHGKGTGALRKRIHDYLREQRIVREFKLGEWNEGGSGMTVVYLKSE